MPRWLLSSAVLLASVAFSSASATAGLFGHWGHHHEADCAVPVDCGVPVSCAMPVDCGVPVSCAAPVDCGVPMVYDNCVEVECGDVPYRKECGLKRGFCKLMDLERRKNRYLKEKLLGWRHRSACHDDHCEPVYYYEADCAVPCEPACAAPTYYEPACAAPSGPDCATPRLHGLFGH